MRAIFTIVTQSYLTYARLLGTRLKSFGEACDFIVFVVDAVGEKGESDTEFCMYKRLEDTIEPVLWQRMTFAYTANELCNAGKAFAHRYLLNSQRYDQWLYLDADIYPITDMTAAWEALEKQHLLITPHVLEPLGDRVGWSTDEKLLVYGIFNGGFLGLQAGELARRFCDWFCSVLQDRCFEGWKGLYVDQLWLNFVPALFPEVEPWRHWGANVGYWNLHERTLHQPHQKHPLITVRDMPLLFVHFSGLDLNEPAKVSRHAASQLPAPELWQKLAIAYVAGLKEQGLDSASRTTYHFLHYPSGENIPLSHRRQFALEGGLGHWQRGDPFMMEDYWREQLTKGRRQELKGKALRFVQKMF
jgi:hypothetical protein